MIPTNCSVVDVCTHIDVHCKRMVRAQVQNGRVMGHEDMWE